MPRFDGELSQVVVHRKQNEKYLESEVSAVVDGKPIDWIPLGVATCANSYLGDVCGSYLAGSCPDE